MSPELFDSQLVIRLILGMVFLLALLTFGLWTMRKSGIGGSFQKVRSKNKRASIVEVQAIDPKRRLIMIRRDDVEHLLLLGPHTDILIEANIQDDESLFEKTLQKASKASSKFSAKAEKTEPHFEASK